RRPRRVLEVDAVRRVRALVEVGEPLAVGLLKTFDGTRELALAEPARALEPDAPAELGEAVERDEVREVVVGRPGAVRERATGVDQRRVERECAEEQVDRL